MAAFFVRCIVYIGCFLLSWYSLRALNYEQFLRKDHVSQAQVLYFLLVMALAYLSGSFLLAFMYHA
ncbi:MAG: DUF1146 domain-containing protein [Solobacterium sp.]|nr:DUF1146 domain-containing protein [Solobacterium sp.]